MLKSLGLGPDETRALCLLQHHRSFDSRACGSQKPWRHRHRVSIIVATCHLALSLCEPKAVIWIQLNPSFAKPFNVIFLLDSMACEPCNRSKGNMFVRDWFRFLYRGDSRSSKRQRPNKRRRYRMKKFLPVTRQRLDTEVDRYWKRSNCCKQNTTDAKRISISAVTFASVSTILSAFS